MFHYNTVEVQKEMNEAIEQLQAILKEKRFRGFVAV